MLTILPFAATPESYANLIETLGQCYPEYKFDPEHERILDETREPAFYFSRHEFFWDGDPAGYGVIYEPREGHRPGKYGWTCRVRPAYRRRGIGSAYFNFGLSILRGLTPPPKYIESETREDQPGAIVFLTDRGFRQEMRFPRSTLETAAFYPDRFAPSIARTTGGGIAIRSLADFMAVDPDALRKFWSLKEEGIMPDVPMLGDYHPMTFGKFVERIERDPHFNPDSIFVALDGAKAVGVTELFEENEESGLWLTGLTGVRREYRRRGIGLALKVRAITHAASLGARTIETDNEENNPMYHLNLHLGFKPQPAWILFKREFPSEQ